MLSAAAARPGVPSGAASDAGQLAWVPRGAALDSGAWTLRHRLLSVLAAGHGLALVLFALVTGASRHQWVEASVLAAAASLSLVSGLPRPVRSCLTSVSLVAASGLLVHVSGGHIEWHFHYFVMIALISLYEDWRPLALSVSGVLLQHTLLAAAAPDALYEDAQAASWPWVALHGIAVLGMSVAVVVLWRLRQNENERAVTRLQAAADLSELLLARAHEPILALDGRGDVTYVNDKAVALLGRPHSELLGRSLHAALHPLPGDCDVERCPVATTASSRGDDGSTDDPVLLELPGPVTAELRVERLGHSGVHLGTAVTLVARDETRLEEQRQAEEVRRALDEGQLVLHYQPKVDLRRGRCVGAEALVRWQHPGRGLLFPDVFLPVVERCGLLHELTSWVATEAVRQIAEWAEAGHRLRVAVNVPPSALVTDDLLTLVSEQLAEHSVSPFSLELEITETGLFDDLPAVVASLHLARSLGISASLDDFGTGFSSLTHLLDLPVRALKVDRSFVMAMADDERSNAVVTSTLVLARQLGLKVVAEGVENEDAVRSLLERGCDFGQGYHWSRPLPPQPFLERVLEINAAAAVRSGIPAPGTSLASDDPLLLAVHRALCSISASTDAASIQSAVVAAVASLGATVQSAEADVDAATTVLDLDCSLGASAEALLAAVPTASLAARRVETALRLLLPEAHRALSRLVTPAPPLPRQRRVRRHDGKAFA